MNKKSEEKHLKLRGEAAVYVDWANVHGWTKSLKREVDPKKLYKYLKSYKEIREIKFYFGTDKNSKSKSFLSAVKKVGYKVITKPVKHIIVAKVKGKIITKRKCDFDMETCIDVHKDLEKEIESFIFFTGDGDFEPLYKHLFSRHKQVIVIYQPGYLGREIWRLKRGIYKTEIRRLGEIFSKKVSRVLRRSLPGRD